MLFTFAAGQLELILLVVGILVFIVGSVFQQGREQQARQARAKRRAEEAKRLSGGATGSGGTGAPATLRERAEARRRQIEAEARRRRGRRPEEASGAAGGPEAARQAPGEGAAHGAAAGGGPGGGSKPRSSVSGRPKTRQRRGVKRGGTMETRRREVAEEREKFKKEKEAAVEARRQAEQRSRGGRERVEPDASWAIHAKVSWLGARPSAADLRRIIVWKTILDPPVALRREGGTGG